MDRRNAVPEFAAGLRGSILALVFGLAAWCAPAQGSTGIVVECEEAERMPALVETSSQPVVIEEVDQDTTEDADAQTPKVTTRLPGVSESVMPSFRRQMLRTDI